MQLVTASSKRTSRVEANRLMLTEQEACCKYTDKKIRKNTGPAGFMGRAGGRTPGLPPARSGPEKKYRNKIK